MTAPTPRLSSDGASGAALSERAIEIVVPPPGPRARQRIAHEQPFISPSLIFCYPLFVRRASGCMVEDVDGNVYLDAQAGVATASTGHCHPAVASAIAAQAQNLIHICGTDFHYPAYGEVCERLNALAARLSPARKITWQTFLTNSGTEAVEAALKLARYHTKRAAIIAFRGGFHGRTFGSLSLTASKTKYRKHFGPFLPGVFHADWGDAASVENDLFGHLVAPEDVAAIVVEPVLGEGGYLLPPVDFLPALRRMCDAHGILLVFDEVQSGMGRTGKMFAAEHFGVVPDVIALAKGIASGMPLGAMMARREVMTWPPGSHGSTCAGNPVCCAAALATLDLLQWGAPGTTQGTVQGTVQETVQGTVQDGPTGDNFQPVGGDAKDAGDGQNESPGLVANADRQGQRLLARLREELDARCGVEDVRGLGLMIGVEFDTHARADAVANLCFRRGLLVLECGHKAIRISPPLIVTGAQIETIAQVFATACRDVFHDNAAPSSRD